MSKDGIKMLRILLAPFLPIAATLAALAALAGVALAQTYQDSPTSAWFKGLSSPYLANCCDQSDCAKAESDYRPIKDWTGRTVGWGWWAKSNRTGTWAPVPADRLTGEVSIFKDAVLCEGAPHYEPGTTAATIPNFYCFAPPPLGF